MPLAFEHLFAVNGRWLYPPENYQEENVPEVATTLAGAPIRQGYQTFVFTWSFMTQEALTSLFEVYDNGVQPWVTVTYIDKETGQLRNMLAMMHAPEVGGRLSIYYQNISWRFTRCEPQ